MSQSEVAQHWQAYLAEHGLTDVRSLIDRTFDVTTLRGRWTRLSKPGLGTRERWRWDLMSPHAGVGTLFVKRYGRPAIRTEIDRWLHQSAWHSRAWWEYRTTQRLQRAYLNVAEPVAVAEQMRGPLEQNSAIIVGRVPGEAIDRTPLDAWTSGEANRSGAGRRDAIQRLARFVAAFHHTSLCHRDLYLCHIFVDQIVDPRPIPRFWLIDVARVLRPRLRRMRWILKDLGQLDFAARQMRISQADRLRFLETYLGLLRGAPRVRWYARRVRHRSDSMWRRAARKGQL